jgi:predicted DNA-binding transcriptional regulator AlpA
MRPHPLDMEHSASNGLESAKSVSVARLALRLDEVAKSLGVSRRAIERARSAGRFPAPDCRIGKCPLWSPETIRRWVARGGSQT